MSLKFAFAAAAPVLATLLFAASPSWAMSVVPAPTNSDGTSRFANPDDAQSGFSGSDQKSSTFGGGKFSFGVTSSQGYGPDYYNQYNQGLSGRAQVQPGFAADPNFPDQAGTGANQGFFNSGRSGDPSANRAFPYWAR
jgi:hypothetical protein